MSNEINVSPHVVRTEHGIHREFDLSAYHEGDVVERYCATCGELRPFKVSCRGADKKWIGAAVHQPCESQEMTQYLDRDYPAIPEGTYSSERGWSRKIFLTLERVRSLPPHAYRIIHDANEVAAARELLTNGPEWLCSLAAYNDWAEDGDVGRVICVEMSSY